MSGPATAMGTVAVALALAVGSASADVAPDGAISVWVQPQPMSRMSGVLSVVRSVRWLVWGSAPADVAHLRISFAWVGMAWVVRGQPQPMSRTGRRLISGPVGLGGCEGQPQPMSRMSGVLSVGGACRWLGWGSAPAD